MPDSIEEEIKALRSEVRYLRDRQDILDCINTYGRGLDRLDADLIRNSFHPDAVDNHGPFVGPVPEFTKFAIDVESSFAWTHHGITSHSCEIDGNSAHAESYVYWIVKLADGTTLAAGGGRYVDRLERRDGRWKISLRRLFMDWTFQIPSKSWLGEEWESVTGTRDRSDPSYQRPLTLPAKLMDALAKKRAGG